MKSKHHVALCACLVGSMSFAFLPSFAADNPEVSKPISDILSVNLKRYLTEKEVHALTADHKVRVFVELDELSVADMAIKKNQDPQQGDTIENQKSHAGLLQDKQNVLRAKIESLGGAFLSSAKVGINGIKIEIHKSKIREVRKLEGVKSVTHVVKYKKANTESVNWIGGSEAHAKNFTGKDITIAVIDTGIDYEHKSFGGAGTTALTSGNDPAVVEEGSFPTTKVIGGVDLAGSVYYGIGDGEGSTPSPDADPMDFDGHGTHVAATAAGFVTDKVGGGVAPEAKLLAIKVFGDFAFSTDLVVEGIEYALDPNGDGSYDDRADVINLSLGGPFGQVDFAGAKAIQAAADLGVIVVAAAGNEGKVPYIVGEPSVSEDAISVAASLAGNKKELALEIEEGADTSFIKELKFVDSFATLEDALLVTAGPLKAADSNLVCSGASDSFDGDIVLISAGACDYDSMFENLGELGVSAAILYAPGSEALNGAPEFLLSEFPVAFVSPQSGELLAKKVAANPSVLAGFSLELNPENDNALADFSAAGPSKMNSSFKPDIAAPGVDVFSAKAQSGDGGIMYSGTSMASPVVAGAAAVIKGKFPWAEIDQVKSIMQNTSRPLYADSAEKQPYPLSWQGAGRIQLDKALEVSAIASPGALSFGRVSSQTSTYLIRKFELSNLTDNARRFKVSLQTNRDLKGVSYRYNKYIYLAPNATTSFNLDISINPEQVNADDALVSQQGVDGWLVLEDEMDTLRVAYLAVIDPSSSVYAYKGAPGTEYLSNWSASTGYAEGFTLLAEESENLDGTSIAAFGFRTVQVNGKDVIQFGYAAKQSWNHPSELDLLVEIDSDRDGENDFQLSCRDKGRSQFPPSYTGELVSFLYNYETQAASMQYKIMSDLNDRWSICSVDLHGEYGFLDEGTEVFDYQLRAITLIDGEEAQYGTVDLSKEIVVNRNALVLKQNEPQEVRFISKPEDSRYMWLLPNNAEESQLMFSK